MTLIECGAEAVEPCLPQSPITGEPDFELMKRLWPERVEASLPGGPHRHETRIMQDPQVPRNTGLVNSSLADDVVHLLLALAKRLDNAATAGIRQCFKRIELHIDAYA